MKELLPFRKLVARNEYQRLESDQGAVYRYAIATNMVTWIAGVNVKFTLAILSTISHQN